jgi:tetratricopeptide (TPR) repeat protein
MQRTLNPLEQEGREAFDRRDFETALELFRAILLEHPGYADVRHYVGLCLAFMGRTEEALAELDEAIAANPTYVEAHINRALVLQELGRYDEARYAFDRAVEFETPGGGYRAAVTARLANAHATLGDLYMEADAPAEAAAQYRTALELRPRFHDIRNKYAASLLALNRIEEALVQLQEVLDWHPRFVAARLNLGLALYRQGRIEAATAEWELCRAQRPGNAQVRAFLSIVEGKDAESRSD